MRGDSNAIHMEPTTFLTASLCRRSSLEVTAQGGGEPDGRRGDGADDAGIDGRVVCLRGLARPYMNLADFLELVLSVALLVYLVYVLVHPERF